MRRSVPAFLITGTATSLVLAACGSAQQASVQPSAPATPIAVTTSTVGASHGTSGTFQGPSVDMRWGPVQVTITMQGKRLTDVQATAPTERQRSAFINDQAVPWLRQETLQAQSANIQLISGATMTSEAFAQSLQAALQQAKS